MYYYIKGKLAHKEDHFIVVDAGGVGYEIFTSLSTMSSIGEPGEDVTVYTYLHVREGIMDLYGFQTPEEKGMFLHLIGVSGVGPKAALSVLSVAPPSKLAAAVITNDAKTIQKAQGVGAKMAQRIILELKDKLKTADLSLPEEDMDSFAADEGGSLQEVISALMVLGYSEKEAKKAAKGLDPSLDLEEMIKICLKRMI